MSDPVELYCCLVGTGFDPANVDKAHASIIRALYAHAKREGMLEAAEICSNLVDKRGAAQEYDAAAECYICDKMIRSAAEEVKP